MIKHTLFALVIFTSFTYAKMAADPKSIHVIESVAIGELGTIVKGDHPKIKDQKTISVVGRHRATDIGQQKRLVQVVWTGLQDEKNRHAAFDKPLITVVQTGASEIGKDVTLPIEGDVKQFDIALEKLKSGQVNDAQEVEAQNPESNARHVLGTDGSSSLEATGDSGGGDNVDGDVVDQQGKSRKAGAQYMHLNQKKRSSPDKSSPSTGKSYASGPQGGYDRKGQGLSSRLGQRDASGLYADLQRHTSMPLSGTQPEEKKEVEVVDCDARIDEIGGRVYKQTKVIHRTNGQITKEEQCTDSLEFFEIKHDYHAEGCEDYINYTERKAYDRFRKYWVDKQGERHYLGDKIYTELDKPHPFIEERGNCRHFIDKQDMKAYPQVETVYYGRGNTRVIVEGCHKDPMRDPVDIHLTTKGCKPEHDYQNNMTHIRKKGIYVLDDVTHEAFGCEPSDISYPHEFDNGNPCKPQHDLSTRKLILMGRRFITTESGERDYLSQKCEPYGSQDLLFGQRGCSGYEHDLSAKRSHLIGKWYYTHGGQSKDVSQCVTGPLSFDHNYEPVGYDHRDQEKISYLIHKVWFDHKGQNIIVDPRYIREDLQQYPYEHTGDEQKPSETRDSRFEGCYKYIPYDLFKAYKRVDDTRYYEFVNTSADRRSGNLCSETTEVSNFTMLQVMFHDYNYHGKLQGKPQKFPKPIIIKKLLKGHDVNLKDLKVDFEIDQLPTYFRNAANHDIQRHLDMKSCFHNPRSGTGFRLHVAGHRTVMASFLTNTQKIMKFPDGRIEVVDQKNEVADGYGVYGCYTPNHTYMMFVPHAEFDYAYTMGEPFQQKGQINRMSKVGGDFNGFMSFEATILQLKMDCDVIFTPSSEALKTKLGM